MARSSATQATVRPIVEDYSETTGLQRKFGALVQKLREIDEKLQSAMIDIVRERNFSGPFAAERMAMIYAVDSLLTSELAWCMLMFRLSRGLSQHYSGVASGRQIVKPQVGRKRDSRELSTLKGRIVAIARLRMESGDSRNDAAAWVARHMPRGLASRLSSKPMKASTVKEWMDQYDCGAKILGAFASEEKRKEFESCFAVPTAAEEEEDKVYLELGLTQMVLRECVPENKWRNSIFGLVGFIMICIDYLGGNPPKFNHLFADLEELARKLIPSDPLPATDF